MTLLEAVNSRMTECRHTSPANSVPFHMLQTASKFEVAQVAAMSIKAQKADLRRAKSLLGKGNAYAAKCYLRAWKIERKNYALLMQILAK
jgi:hypothetical protein